jgi:ribonuclease G
MNVQILEKCPACEGTGEIRPSILLSDDIENSISYLVREQNEKYLSLFVHPYLYAYLTKGLFNYKWKWWRRYKLRVYIRPQSSYHFLEYHFFNRNGDEIKM